MKELDIESAALMFEYTQARMARASRPSYEISNYAEPGEESRHNLVYWRYGDYVGVGPGAHGRLTLAGNRIATETERQPERWLSQVTSTGNGITKWELIEPDQQQSEALLMGLRLSEGVDQSRIEAINGRSLSGIRIAKLVEQGFVSTQAGRVAATHRGRLVLNAVLKELLA